MFAKVYWLAPLISALMWLATLLALLIDWVANGEPHYASMEPDQTIAYISDVGAEHLKPLFITGACITVIGLDIGLIAERWLRHRGRLAPNTSWWQKSLSIVAIIAGIVGAAGLILLSIFDTLRHPNLHDDFLIVFIVGYVVSAIAICAEYQRLGVHFREHRILRVSFWMKLGFIIVEVAVAVAFGVESTSGNSHQNTAAVLEWVVAFIFTFYVFTFAMDLLPAIRTKHHHSEETMTEMRGTAVNGNGNYDSVAPNVAPNGTYLDNAGYPVARPAVAKNY